VLSHFSFLVGVPVTFIEETIPISVGTNKARVDRGKSQQALVHNTQKKLQHHFNSIPQLLMSPERIQTKD